MKQKTVIVFAIAATLAVPTSAPAQSFQKFYKGFIPKLVKAFETGDVKFFDEITTADFTDKTSRGTENKATSLADMKQQFASTKKMTCKVKTLSSKEVGSKASTTVWMKVNMVVSVAGKDHAMSMEMTESESWVKVGSTWKVKSINEGRPQKVTMDGKSVPASAIGG